MKKIAAILLAVVIILALVGCDVSTRNYRRYPYRTGTYNTTLDGAYDGAYRTDRSTRNYGASEGSLYNGNYAGGARDYAGGMYNRSYAGGAYNRAGTVNPGLGAYGNGTLNSGLNRAIPANPTDGSTLNRSGNNTTLNRSGDNQINNRVVTRNAIKAR